MVELLPLNELVIKGLILYLERGSLEKWPAASAGRRWLNTPSIYYRVKTHKKLLIYFSPSLMNKLERCFSRIIGASGTKETV